MVTPAILSSREPGVTAVVPEPYRMSTRPPAAADVVPKTISP